LLGLDASDRQQLSDHAAIARGQIAADLKDEEILAKMPAFFRAIRGPEYSREDFEKFMSKVKELHQA
jgi:hypothetical protein